MGATFVVGQRVRVCKYEPAHPMNPEWGDPHFIVGHFGKVESIYGVHINVRITRGPNGPLDARVQARERFGSHWDLWPLLIDEIEPVD